MTSVVGPDITVPVPILGRTRLSAIALRYGSIKASNYRPRDLAFFIQIKANGFITLAFVNIRPNSIERLCVGVKISYILTECLLRILLHSLLSSDHVDHTELLLGELLLGKDEHVFESRRVYHGGNWPGASLQDTSVRNNGAGKICFHGGIKGRLICCRLST